MAKRISYIKKSGTYWIRIDSCGGVGAATPLEVQLWKENIRLKKQVKRLKAAMRTGEEK